MASLPLIILKGDGLYSYDGVNTSPYPVSGLNQSGLYFAKHFNGKLYAWKTGEFYRISNGAVEKTWTCGTEMPTDLAIDPVTGGLFVACMGGLFLAEDSASSLSLVTDLAGLGIGNMISCIAVSSTGRIFLGTQGSNGAAGVASYDTGTSSWFPLTNGYVNDIVIYTDTTDTEYMCAGFLDAGYATYSYGIVRFDASSGALIDTPDFSSDLPPGSSSPNIRSMEVVGNQMFILTSEYSVNSPSAVIKVDISAFSWSNRTLLINGNNLSLSIMGMSVVDSSQMFLQGSFGNQQGEIGSLDITYQSYTTLYQTQESDPIYQSFLTSSAPGVNLDTTSAFLVKGKVLANISFDPTQNSVTYLGSDLPVGSIVKDTSSGVKYIKISGGVKAFQDIRVTPRSEWAWASGSESSWSVLQNKWIPAGA